MCLDNETSARKALKKFVRYCKKLPGRPKEVWLNYVKQTLTNSHMGMTFKSNEIMIKELEGICQDRESWRKIVREIVVHNVHAQKKKNTE